MQKPDYSIVSGEEKCPADSHVDSGWYVYLLTCADGSLYTGITVAPERRLRQHNGELAGGARYTRARRPVRLSWSASVVSRSTAQRVEAALKSLTRAAKLRLVRGQLRLVHTDEAVLFVEERIG